MTITRVSETDFDVTTDTVLSDGSLRRDACCRLHGNRLRSHEQIGHVRIGGLLCVNLGPATLPLVSNLAVGDSLTVHPGHVQ